MCAFVWYRVKKGKGRRRGRMSNNRRAIHVVSHEIAQKRGVFPPIEQSNCTSFVTLPSKTWFVRQAPAGAVFDLTRNTVTDKIGSLSLPNRKLMISYETLGKWSYSATTCGLKPQSEWVSTPVLDKLTPAELSTAYTVGVSMNELNGEEVMKDQKVLQNCIHHGLTYLLNPAAEAIQAGQDVYWDIPKGDDYPKLPVLKAIPAHIDVLHEEYNRVYTAQVGNGVAVAIASARNQLENTLFGTAGTIAWDADLTNLAAAGAVLKAALSDYNCFQRILRQRYVGKCVRHTEKNSATVVLVQPPV